MKYVIAALALAGLMGATALADATGGIVGSVVDSTTGKTLANVPISITRVEASPQTWNTKTNGKGAFSDITLQPGRYLVALGGFMTRENALSLQKKARAAGLSRDVFVHNYVD